MYSIVEDSIDETILTPENIEKYKELNEKEKTVLDVKKDKKDIKVEVKIKDKRDIKAEVKIKDKKEKDGK
jgi:hypothetical protein